MENPVDKISLGNLLQNSKNFDFLRQHGVKLIQQLASATWTDHNPHDPGITLLETLCYALSEAGLQAGAASAQESIDEVYTYISNLLSSEQQTAQQEFFTCSEVLPCAPVSLSDFQKLLLDHPGIKRAWVSVIDGTPGGRLSVLQQFNPKVNNVISSSVEVSGTSYTINFIFPLWNDPASRPLQSAIILKKVSFQDSLDPWTQIADTHMYSATITVNYEKTNTSEPVSSFLLSVLLQIITPGVSADNLPLVLQESANLLALLGNNSISDDSILKQYNHRLIFSADRNNDLNSNILRTEVSVSGNKYQVEIAFPYWDDPETTPFQKDVRITNPVFQPDTVNPWKAISGTDSYFSFLDFMQDGNATSWPVVLRIIDSTSGLTAIIRDRILETAAHILKTPSTNPPLLKQYNQKVMMAYESSHRIRSSLKNYRNLCESFSAYRSVRIQEVGISAIIEMDAGADIETLLANIFYFLFQHISPQVIPQSLSDLQTKLPVESIFEGPLLKHGFIRDTPFNSSLPSNILYVSDVIRIIMKMGSGSDIQTREDEKNRPVISVTNVSLSLYLDNRSITTSAKDCLQLINSTRHIPQLSIEKSSITITRNNMVVCYDLNKVLDLYNKQINAATYAHVISPDTPTNIPIPVGESFEMGDYYSIQNDLSLTYGVGKAGPPASSSPQRKAQSKQLQGYLLLFEQILAGYFTQLAHVNALFSADSSASTTLYQLPLYDVPGAQDLLMHSAPSVEKWLEFTSDPNNHYMEILKKGPETEEQFLIRRHQMLDHLLGRLGEDMEAFSSLIYRQSYSNPNSLWSSASTALLQLKADYYYALPDLDKNRSQAYGQPAWRNKDLINIYSSPDNSFYMWQILDDHGNTLFRQSVPEANKTIAEERAEAAMTLATSEVNYYTETDLHGLQRIALRWSAGEPSIAISDKSYATVAEAENDIPHLQQSILNLWLKYSLSSLETRLYHLLGISTKGERRKLINPSGDYFDIFDTTIPPPYNKKIRLRSATDPASQVLIESQDTHSDNDELSAISLANDGIYEIIKCGLAPGNFKVESSSPISLCNSGGHIIAQSPVDYNSEEEARTAIIQIQQLLYRYYSNEGFYIIEHPLLYPISTDDSALIFPDSLSSCLPVSSSGVPYTLPKDPYSFILTIAFPSGYARDFSDTSKTVLKFEMQPDRFRDIEFRQYAEQTIRKYCPAHILPLIVWLDTAITGTALINSSNKLYPCFDNLELTYTSWLSAFFTDDVDPLVIAPLRNKLVGVLNGIFSDPK